MRESPRESRRAGPGRPRADAVAFRVIASPYFGVLYRGELWTEDEWRREERTRARYRRYRTRQREADR